MRPPRHHRLPLGQRPWPPRRRHATPRPTLALRVTWHRTRWFAHSLASSWRTTRTGLHISSASTTRRCSLTWIPCWRHTRTASTSCTSRCAPSTMSTCSLCIQGRWHGLEETLHGTQILVRISSALALDLSRVRSARLVSPAWVSMMVVMMQGRPAARLPLRWVGGSCQAENVPTFQAPRQGRPLARGCGSAKGRARGSGGLCGLVVHQLPRGRRGWLSALGSEAPLAASLACSSWRRRALCSRRRRRSARLLVLASRCSPSATRRALLLLHVVVVLT